MTSIKRKKRSQVISRACIITFRIWSGKDIFIFFIFVNTPYQLYDTEIKERERVCAIDR